MIPFFGGFHPLVVHLPIGILLVALFFEVLAIKTRFQALSQAVTPLLFVAAITAILSSVTGYWLSASGDYSSDTLDRHKWMGLWTALLISVTWALRYHRQRFPQLRLFYQGFCFLIFLMILITGHYGGTLTHGSGYLTKNLPDPLKNRLGLSTPEIKKIQVTNVQEAAVYQDLVAGIFETKCTGCHGPDKQKGKLRLDAQDFILKGGKDGIVLQPGSPENSELIKRILLDEKHDDHMPPREKPQLTDSEIELIHWWIKNGAEFNRKVSEMPQNDTVRAMLMSFQSGEQVGGSLPPVLPDDTVAAANPLLIDSLRKDGISVQWLAPQSNYLSAGFINNHNPSQKTMRLLNGLRNQLLVLNLADTHLGDSGIRIVSGMVSLRRLNLSGTDLTDSTVQLLDSLKKLEYLNLSETGVSFEGLKKLKNLSALRALYLYNSKVAPAVYEDLRKLFPTASIDTGGYIVPVLASDTTIFKLPKKKKKKGDD